MDVAFKVDKTVARRWMEYKEKEWGVVESRSLEPPLEVTRSNLKRFSIVLTAGPARINRMDVTEKRVGNLKDPRFLAETKEAKRQERTQSFRSYKNHEPFSEHPERANLIC